MKSLFAVVLLAVSFGAYSAEQKQKPVFPAFPSEVAVWLAEALNSPLVDEQLALVGALPTIKLTLVRKNGNEVRIFIFQVLLTEIGNGDFQVPQNFDESTVVFVKMIGYDGGELYKREWTNKPLVTHFYEELKKRKLPGRTDFRYKV
ncbi:hypothetical protein A3A20_00200 [Candidatus Wolfebacteria bacterium RIFCSPLOWO2_01_FULL_45_19]|uniref:Uncharacterized protein n=1 Tax=Candidatus Wolfebacteria bacterium RIFCSPLOWO2_01_FULL_45_19 TaxID=1802557 RepID=A0A1F8DQU1_9BACT|nr:MAG: hypothetical protein A3A20_00200 [Candidatus Wolfebacteria bacterium RIFCSPLOWO2_01_FULL_45_19]